MGANALREQDKQQSKWISVKDRLPDKTDTYLTDIMIIHSQECLYRFYFD